MKTLSSYRSYRTRRRFLGLDGIRALAIAMVFFHHSVESRVLSNSAHGVGAYGVQLFFLLSGFLIPTLLIREHEARGTIDLPRFWARRSLRIFPLYFLVLGVYALLALSGQAGARGATFFQDLPYFLSYTSNLFVPLRPEGTIFYFAWSLATEEQFYLTWPWIERRFPNQAGNLALAAYLFTLGVTEVLGLGRTQGPLWCRVLGSFAPAIFLGVFLAHALHHAPTHRSIRDLVLALPRGTGLLLAGLGLVAFPGSPRVVEWGFAAFLLEVLLRPRASMTQALEHPLLVWLGQRSYAYYLFHMLAWNLARRVLAPGPFCLDFLLAYVLTGVLAELSHIWIEAPLMAWKKRFEVRR